MFKLWLLINSWPKLDYLLFSTCRGPKCDVQILFLLYVFPHFVGLLVWLVNLICLYNFLVLSSDFELNFSLFAIHNLKMPIKTLTGNCLEILSYFWTVKVGIWNFKVWIFWFYLKLFVETDFLDFISYDCVFAILLYC